MRRALITLAWAIGLCGCWDNTRQSNAPPNDPIRLKLSPELVQANTLASTRVDSLARSILAANPHIDAKPIVQTIGVAQPEIFHNGMTRLVITQGLVEACRTEEELAAVLCFELGRMVAEREAVSPVNRRHANPPTDPAGRAVTVNDASRRDQSTPAEPPDLLPDPDALARMYLREPASHPRASTG